MRYLLFTLLISISSQVYATEQVIEVDVLGLTCPFCQDGLDRSLSKLPGVKEAEVSLKLKKARITMHPQQTLDDKTLRDTVIDSGFTPGEIRRQE